MFKKLKDKIAEEVKISPQRIQQFTQSVQDKINQSISTDDNLFSIGEDDTSASNLNTDAGFSNVSLNNSYDRRIRRNSNSSVASDVSFLPRYEPAGNLYHIQSDLDISASEVEDNASTSSQLGHISKEQVYSAYRKSQERYHKYRGRFTDLANHYKELERENAKMKSVLVETQDKAIRRVSELKEQCVLEQQAKAHLENILQVELDERQCIIDTLKQKIELLQSNKSSSNLIEIDDPSKATNNSSENLEQLTKYLNDARVEIENLNSKILEYKANSIVFQSKTTEFTSKINDLEAKLAEAKKDCNSYKEKEIENNLTLAQVKQELHNEIHLKDAEIAILKSEVEAQMSKNKSAPTNSKLENLQTQNGKLIEKVESLTQKCNNYEAELLKIEQYKLENKTIADQMLALQGEVLKIEQDNTTDFDGPIHIRVQEKLSTIQKLVQDHKTLKSLQEKETMDRQELQEFIKENTELKAVIAEHDEKITELNQQNELLKTQVTNLNDMENQNKEMQEKLNKLTAESNENTTLNDDLQLVKNENKQLKDDINKLTQEHDNLKADFNKISLENNKYSESQTQHLNLKSEYDVLQKELFILSNVEREYSELKATCNDLTMQLAEMKNMYHDSVKSEEHLNSTIDTLHEEKNGVIRNMSKYFDDFKEKYDKLLFDYEALKEVEAKYNGLLKENGELQENLSELSHVSSEFEKLKLSNEALLQNEKEVISVKIDSVQTENGTLKETLRDLEEKLRKFEEITIENSQLRDDNERVNKELKEISSKCEKYLLRLEESNFKVEQFVNLLEESDMKMKSQEYEFEQRVLNDREKFKHSLLTLEERVRTKISADFDSKQLQKQEQFKEKLIEISNEHCTDADLQLKLIEKSDRIDTLLEEIKKINEIVENKNIRYEELEKTHLELIEEGNATRTELSESEKTISSLEKDLEHHKTELVRFKNELTLLQQVTTDQQNNIIKLTSQIAELEKELKQETEKFTDKTKENDSIQEKINGLTIEKEQLNKECSTLKENLKQLDKVRANNGSLEKSNLELTETITGLKNQIEMMQKGNSNELTQVQNKLMDLEQEKARLISEVNEKDSIKIELEQLQAHSNELSKKVDEYNKKITELTLEREKLLDDLSDKNSVSIEYDNLKSTNTELTNKIDSLSNEIVVLMQEQDRLTSELNNKNELTVEIGKLQSVNQELSVANKDNLEKIEALSSKVSLFDQEKLKIKAQIKEKFVLKEELENVQLSNVDLTKSIKEHMDKIEDLYNKIQQLENENSQLHNEIDAHQEQHGNSDGKLSSLQSDLTKKEILLADLTAQCHEKDAVINDLHIQLQSSNSISNDELEKLKELESCTKNLQGKLDEERCRSQEVAIKLEGCEVSNKELQDKLNNETTKCLEATIKLNDVQSSCSEAQKNLEEITRLYEDEVRKTETFKQQLDEVKERMDFLANEDIRSKYEILTQETKSIKNELNNLERICAESSKEKEKLQLQLHEIERQYSEICHEKQLLQDEVEELKTYPMNINESNSKAVASKLDNLQLLKAENMNNSEPNDNSNYLKEINDLREKLRQYKSLDMTNRSSIEFYENELQKMKNKNEKINRKLDETLVTLNHCTDLANTTEIEYLKNVLYNYMLGKESLVLARVIAAVCKFDKDQTDAILQKEQQKQTLLGQLGLL